MTGVMKPPSNSGGHFVFQFEKKWGEHPEFEHPEYGRFQVVHVYRTCFFLKECHLLVLCFLGKVG